MTPNAIEIIIEWAKKERQPLYRDLAYQADMDYYDLKEDHKYRVQRVQELLEENKKLTLSLSKAWEVIDRLAFLTFLRNNGYGFSRDEEGYRLAIEWLKEYEN